MVVCLNRGVTLFGEWVFGARYWVFGCFLRSEEYSIADHAENRIYADRPAVKGCDAMITHKSASAANLSIKMRRYQTFEVSQTSKVYNRCGFSKIWVITATTLAVTDDCELAAGRLSPP
jgi:hypothetical protein